MKHNRSAKIKALLLLFLIVLQASAGYACVADRAASVPDRQCNTIHLPFGHHQADCCADNPEHRVNLVPLSVSPATGPFLYPGLLVLYPPPSFVFVFLSTEKLMRGSSHMPAQQRFPPTDIRIAIQSFQI